MKLLVPAFFVGGANMKADLVNERNKIPEQTDYGMEEGAVND